MNDLIKMCFELKNAVMDAGDVLISDFKKTGPDPRDSFKASLDSNEVIVSSLLDRWFKSTDQEVTVISGAMVSLKRARRKARGYVLEDLERGISYIDGPCFAVESLCGRNAFEKGLSDFCSSIAYIENGQIMSAVVFDPVHVELFHAGADLGAYMNGRRMTVSATKNLMNAYVSVGNYTLHAADKTALQRLFDEAMHIRVAEAGPLEICYTACGRTDAVIAWNLTLCEYAAGLLCLREAGAKIISPKDTMPDVAADGRGRLNLVASCPGISAEIGEITGSF